MAKHLNLKLFIPEPCTQNWDDMTPRSTGRHCDNCKKIVVDFSNFTDKELVEFFKKASGEICGRINPSQCNRPMPILEKSNNAFFYKALFGTALVTGITGVAEGQMLNRVNTLVKVPVYNGNIYQDAKVDHTQPTTRKETKHNTVYGTVVDDTSKKPLEFVSVYLEGHYEIYATTDSAGHFEIAIPDSLLGKELIFEFYKRGHKTVEMSADAHALPYRMDISMVEREEPPLMGKMMYRRE